MDTKLIEELDRHRCRIMLWQSIALFALFGGLAVSMAAGDTTIGNVGITVSMVGVAMVLVGIFLHVRLTKRINSDSTLKAALNNELVTLYSYKAMCWAFVATMGVAILFTIVLAFFPTAIVSPRLLVSIIMGVGTTTLYLAHYIYMRR